LTQVGHCRTLANVETETTTSELVHTAAAALILGCSYRTVLRMVESGDLREAGKVPGKTGAYMFRRADVEALAAERAQRAAEAVAS